MHEVFEAVVSRVEKQGFRARTVKTFLLVHRLYEIVMICDPFVTEMLDMSRQ